VAGAAVGKNLGVASSANLVSVAFSLLNEADTMLALTNTYNDIVSKNRQGKAVINMSWGWSAPTRDSLNYWMAKAINMFIEIGVVPVCAAGNNGNQALSSELISANVPAAYRGQIDGLIVVGAVDSGGKRTVFTPRCDALDSTSTCATAYAMGEDVTCATNESSYKLDSGTSFASPIVAGLAAYIMAHPNADVQTFVNGGSNGQIASKVSTIIQGWSWSRNASDGLNYPNVAWNGVVANSCNLKTTASAGSTPTGAAKRDNVKRQAATIDTSDVSLTTVSTCTSLNCPRIGGMLTVGAKSATCPLPTATQASFKRRNADSEALDHIASTDARLVCHQARDANGPSADDIKEHLLTNDFLDRICRPDSPKGDMIEISFSNVTMVARVSCAHAAELEVCHSGIKALIDGCIVKQNFFGGIYLQGGTLYTISNVALLG
jgi:hypothetical protein